MAACDEVAQEIRDVWSAQGVEVESLSDRKVRCRFPPFFRGIQNFVASLDVFEVAIDLETTMSAGTASVVMIVYAHDNYQPHSRDQPPLDPYPALTRYRNDVMYISLAAICVVLQFISVCGWQNIVSTLQTTGKYVLGMKQ